VARQARRRCHRHFFPDELTDLAVPEAVERHSRQPGPIEERQEVALVYVPHLEKAVSPLSMLLLCHVLLGQRANADKELTLVERRG